MEEARPQPPQFYPGHAVSLQDAVEVLNDLADARPINDRRRLVCGALALNTVTWTCDDRDIADAAIGLEILATGGTLDLDEHGRKRAAFLATAVQALISNSSEIDDDDVD